MKGMILGAGYGERLWPLTADRTKPALPVLGKPLVGYVAEYLAQAGITDVVVNLHHQPDSVRRALGDGSQFGVKLRYVHEPVILGTSGALDNARDVLSHSTVDVYPQAIAKGEPVAAHVAEGMWYELSTLQRYLDISLALLNQRGLNLYAGDNPSIDRQAEVRESILWNEVTIEAGARVQRAVLGDGVRVRAGELVDEAVVVRADLVAGLTPPAKALGGYVRGENFVVPLSQ